MESNPRDSGALGNDTLQNSIFLNHQKHFFQILGYLILRGLRLRRFDSEGCQTPGYKILMLFKSDIAGS